MKFGPVERRLMEDCFGTGSNTSMRNGCNEVLVPREEEWKSRTQGASRTDGDDEAPVIGWNACRFNIVLIRTGRDPQIKRPYLSGTPQYAKPKKTAAGRCGLPIRIQDET